jgi:nitrite reductase/ring-hydroxylating ferredoxin subunit
MGAASGIDLIGNHAAAQFRDVTSRRASRSPTKGPRGDNACHRGYRAFFFQTYATPWGHNGRVTDAQEVCAANDLPPGTVQASGRWAVGNTGSQLFAVSRRCRHLGADLANGTIDKHGCLVCPWHGARYDVATGRMVRGPQGVFARVPGLDAVERALTSLFPLRRRDVVERDGMVTFAD